MATAKNVALQGIGYGATQTALQGFGEAVTTFSAALTDGPDSLAASVSVVFRASVSATDGPDSLAASVSPVVTASVAATDGADTVSASVSPLVTASSATTDGADLLSASVSPVVTASSSTTDGADTLAASVVVGNAAVFSSATTDGADSASASVIPVVTFSSSTTDGADALAAYVVLVGGAAVFSSDTTDGPDTLDSSVRVGSVGGGYYDTKRRYVTRINGKLVEFASEAEAANALQATGQARKEVVKKAAAAVDLSAVKKLAADRMALGVFQQQLQQMQFEALMRSYEQWQDEQDIEDLMALL